jgi:hypothetical protein
MVYQLLLKKKTHPTNTVIQKMKQPPTQLCAFINPYFNTKLLKAYNNFIIFEHPLHNSLKIETTSHGYVDMAHNVSEETRSTLKR